MTTRVTQCARRGKAPKKRGLPQSQREWSFTVSWFFGVKTYAVYTKWPAVLYIFSVNLSNRKNRAILNWCRLRIGGGSWIIADPKNSRPVSLTSLTSKVMEHIHVVSYHIPRHLSTNRIISQHQHSFRRGLLCETQLRSSPSYTDGH